MITAGVQLLTLFALMFEPAEFDRDELMEAVREALREVVQDEARLQQAEAILEESTQDHEERRAETSKRLRSFWAIDSRYDATLEDYMEEVQAIDNAYKEWHSDYLSRNKRLKQVFTKEEWSALWAELDKPIQEFLKKKGKAATK